MKWNPFKKDVPVPHTQPVQHLFVPKNLPLQTKHAFLTPRKWVVCNKKVGIIASLDTSGFAVVDYTDANGITIASERVSGGNIRLARYEEIPLAGRPVNPAYAALLGYV